MKTCYLYHIIDPFGGIKHTLISQIDKPMLVGVTSLSSIRRIGSSEKIWKQFIIIYVTWVRLCSDVQ